MVTTSTNEIDSSLIQIRPILILNEESPRHNAHNRLKLGFSLCFIAFLVFSLTILMNFGKKSDLTKNIIEKLRGNVVEDIRTLEPIEESEKTTKGPEIALKSTCQTPECEKLAENIKNFIDDAKSPCDDFYAHACGNYRYNHDEKTEKFFKFEQQSKEALRAVTVYLANNKTDAVLPAEILLQKTYRKCVQREESNVFDVFRDLKEKIGWPMEKNKNVGLSSYDINMKLAHFLSLNADSAQFFFIEGYRKLLDIVPIFCDMGVRPIDTGIVNEVIGKLDGEELESAKEGLRMALEVDKVRESCKKTPKPQSKTLPGNHSLVENNSRIDFGLILQTLVGRNERGVRSGLLKQTLIFNSSEFTDPSSTINQLFEKNPIGVANYLAIRYIESFVRSDLLMQDEQCARKVFNLLPRTSLSMYINHFVRKENIQKIPILVDELKSEFNKILSSNSWMSDATREMLEQRIARFHTDIGDQYAAGTEDKLLKKLEISEDDSFYSFYTRLNSFTAKNAMEYVLGDQDMSEEVEEMDSKSNYNHRLSAKKLLAPMILEPIFDIDFPLAVQFGKAGAVIGHELGHLVHPLDRNLKRDNGWDGDSVHQYERKENCVLEGLNLSKGWRRQWMGDYFGMKAALRGFGYSEKANDSKLNGWNGVDDTKLFFYSVAQMKCQQKERVSKKESLPLNRIISHFPEFSEAFQCPLGTAMNPKKKCAVF